MSGSDSHDAVHWAADHKSSCNGFRGSSTLGDGREEEAARVLLGRREEVGRARVAWCGRGRGEGGGGEREGESAVMIVRGEV